MAFTGAAGFARRLCSHFLPATGVEAFVVFVVVVVAAGEVTVWLCGSFVVEILVFVVVVVVVVSTAKLL